jgi:hypothetical protein
MPYRFLNDLNIHRTVGIGVIFLHGDFKLSLRLGWYIGVHLNRINEERSADENETVFYLLFGLYCRSGCGPVSSAPGEPTASF